MKVNVSGIRKEILLAGLYKFATVQGIGHVEQLALGSAGKPFITFNEATLINEYQANKEGKLYFTSLFGKSLFVDISGDEVDFTAYDFHNGSGLGNFVVSLATTKSKLTFLSEPISDFNAHAQLYCAMNACYQGIPIEEFNASMTNGKHEEINSTLAHKYYKNLSNHVGFPLTIVSTEKKSFALNVYQDTTSRAPHEVRAASGCFYQEIGIEQMSAESALALCEKELNAAITFFETTRDNVFCTPIVRRDTRLLPLRTPIDYYVFFSSYQMLPVEKIPAAIPTRYRPDPNNAKLNLKLTDSQKMLLNFGFKPTAIVGDTLVFSKGISGDELANMLGTVSSKEGSAEPNAFYLRWKTSDPNHALRRAAFQFGPDDIKSILDRDDANINGQDNNPQKKYTALHIALMENKIQNALYLLKKGARYDIPDANGQTALTYAIEKSITPILTFFSTQILQSYKVDTISKAFRMAAHNDNLRNLQVLLKLGVEINEAGASGTTALHYAAKAGHENIVAFLVQNGARKDLTDLKGKTAIYYATKTKVKELLSTTKPEKMKMIA